MESTQPIPRKCNEKHYEYIDGEVQFKSETLKRIQHAAKIVIDYALLTKTRPLLTDVIDFINIRELIIHEDEVYFTVYDKMIPVETMSAPIQFDGTVQFNNEKRHMLV